MVVVFFDIDGTLIDTGGAGGAAMRRAFCRVFGVDRAPDVPFSGRTDRAIAASMMAAGAVADDEANWQVLKAAYLDEPPRQLPLHTGRTLEGVEELVRELAHRKDVATGLLTGNVRRGAQCKLAHYGLADFFDFGGFGDEFLDRDAVAREAVVAAEAFLGCRPERMVVIGDTPHDITCGRAIGAEVVAVATGIHSTEELARLAPDRLVAQLTDLDGFI